MKKLATALVALFAVVSSAHAQAVPQIPVESVPDFFRLPAGVNFGEVPAVAVNSQGHVFVFSRSNATGGGPAYGIHAAQLFEFGPSGEFFREHGRGLYSWAFARGATRQGWSKGSDDAVIHETSFVVQRVRNPSGEGSARPHR